MNMEIIALARGWKWDSLEAMPKGKVGDHLVVAVSEDPNDPAAAYGERWGERCSSSASCHVSLIGTDP